LLEEQMKTELKLLGLEEIVHPIFYNSPVGIRFEIGCGEVYDNSDDVRSKYINAALNRTLQLFKNALPTAKLLMWEIYPQKDDEQLFLREFENKTSLSIPQEKTEANVVVDGEVTKRVRFYWDIEKQDVPIERLFKEIILGDLGGFPALVSSVYLFDFDCHVMFHLYDDRGLDIVSKDKETLVPSYKQYSSWILDSDRKRVDAIFR
jgi:hypothetical protein